MYFLIRKKNYKIKNVTLHIQYAIRWRLPPEDYLQPAPPAADVHSFPSPVRRSPRRTCRWSQTWLHLAGHSGWWRNPKRATGSLCQNPQPHGRTRAKPLGSRCHLPTAVRSQYSPGNGKKNRGNVLLNGKLRQKNILHLKY